jgi:aryl-alcohol dehydrogenase-like predicted oxidoreductase
METRILGRTGRKVSVVGLGAWQIGDAWGTVPEDDAREVVRSALAAGVSLIDTADVYGDGRSERIVGETAVGPDVFVATKMGRRVEQRPENYHLENFRSWTGRSRRLLGVDSLDLVQLHCPPDAVFAHDAVFDGLDTLVAEGAVQAYGVSVETCAQALAAIERPGVASVQIILNCFRQKPLDEVLPAALEAGVGIIARVPLASGLLSGRFDESTTFAADDHRNYNRHGESFNVGETFAGVPYEVGVAAARELAEFVPEGATMAQFALRWIIDQPGVSVVIPGARSGDQARANAAGADLAPLSEAQRAGVRDVYDRVIRPHVHHRW